MISAALTVYRCSCCTDFDLAGFVIRATLKRDTRRFQFSNAIEVVDLGLSLDDIAGLEREPAAASKVRPSVLRAQLSENGASDAEIDILLKERVELNAMTSDALIAMIERKLQAYGLEKVVPDEDLLAETYRAFHRSQRLRERFKAMEQQFDKEAAVADIPEGLEQRVRAVLADARRSAVGRGNPGRAGPNADFSCASGEGKGSEEVWRLHEPPRRRRGRIARVPHFPHIEETNSLPARCMMSCHGLSSGGEHGAGAPVPATKRCGVVGVLTLAPHRRQAPIRELQVQVAPWGLRQTEQLTSPDDVGQWCRRWAMQGAGQGNRERPADRRPSRRCPFSASESHVAVTACRGRIDVAGQFLPEAIDLVNARIKGQRARPAPLPVFGNPPR